MPLNDIRAATKGGGFTPLGSETLAVTASAALLFTSIATYPRTVMVSVNVPSGATLYITYDGTTPTTTNGHAYTAGTYDWTLSYKDLLAVKAIGSGTISCYCTYFGIR